MDTQLTPQQLSEFHTRGFVLIPNALSTDDLVKARAAYWKMWEKCMSGKYPHFRTLNQLSDYHIYGIEYMFHPSIYERNMFQAVIRSNALPFSQQILGTKETFMALNRIHCTQKFSYSGFWHRDGEPKQSSHVQSGLFLYNETRFFLIPGSHKRSDTPLEAKTIAENRWRGDLPGQIQLSAEAGSLLLFHSSIVHRASCVGRKPYNRAYIHFRIADIKLARSLARAPERHFERTEILNDCDDNWRRMFSRTDVPPPDQPGNVIYRPPIDSSYAEKTKKGVALLAYYGLCWLPEGSWFFAKYKRFVPYLWPKRGFEIRPKNAQLEELDGRN